MTASEPNRPVAAHSLDSLDGGDPHAGDLVNGPARAAGPTVDEASAGDDDLIIDEVLVEEISIDGMCGVY